MCIFAVGMKRVTNIIMSSIVLTLMLLGTAGVSVERCSCTGKISLALPTEGGCCPDEGGCMTLKSMQLSDYMPTTMASLDMPVQLMLFSVEPVETDGDRWERVRMDRYGWDPPEALAHTVTVLRV